ncbi:MAG: FtsX-like permease family protein [Acidobacteria bacterium]|nr:FtsX-like permease family protein [Acidobacteriota bacterium]
MRAIGGLRSQIRRMILLEASAIVIVGVLIGALAGLLNTYFLVRTASTMVGGYTVPFRFDLDRNRVIAVRIDHSSGCRMVAGPGKP